MKKVLNIVLLFILGLTFISCDRMLKDSLADGSGFGDVILNETNVTIDASLSVTSGALDFSKAEVKIDGKTGTTGVAFKNVKSGSQTMTITVPSADGKKVYSGSGTVAIKANEQITASVILNTEKNATNAYKFIFDPVAYGVTVTNEVHLVGIADWDTANKSYPLVKQANGTWIGYFDVQAGTEFKFIYDTDTSNSWGNAKGFVDNQGSNAKVEEKTNCIEAVMVWQFMFDPTAYGITVTNEVHLVGIADWDTANKSYPLVKQANGAWIGYFNVQAGTEFKFIYDTDTSNSWGNSKGFVDNQGSNAKVEEKTGAVTQNF